MAAPEAYIFTTPQRVGKHVYERGDRYDQAVCGLTDDIDRTLKHIRTVVPLTPEAYFSAMQQRAAGTVGEGFTIDELLEWEIIDAAQARRLHAANQAGEIVKGYSVLPVKHGNFTRYEVKDPRGVLMREQAFSKHEAAVAFIDSLAPLGQDGDEPESTDGLHLRQGAPAAA